MISLQLFLDICICSIARQPNNPAPIQTVYTITTSIGRQFLVAQGTMDPSNRPHHTATRSVKLDTLVYAVGREPASTAAKSNSSRVRTLAAEYLKGTENATRLERRNGQREGIWNSEV